VVYKRHLKKRKKERKKYIKEERRKTKENGKIHGTTVLR
jgi:hypothetical protein